MADDSLPLFTQFPTLHSRLPRVSLTQLPSPVHRLKKLESAVGDAALWIKRDDRAGRWYGGNKPRKLEFLLGEAQKRGSSSVVTFGTLGTHHGLATTICASRIGLETVLVLLDEPVREAVCENLLRCHALGANLIYASSPWKATVLGAWQVVRRSRPWRGQFPYVIMPGGSTSIGAVGYVNAALELENQVGAGELPEPDYIFVAVGSNGTLAGLTAGLRLTNLRTAVIGVTVSDAVRIDAAAVAQLANDTLDLLGRHAPDIAVVGRIAVDEVTLWHGYLGAGYAHSTPAAERAINLMRKHEGIELEHVYTGKALAALLDAARQPEFENRCILFWNTFNSLPVPGPAPGEWSYRQLPSAFHHFFAG